MNRRRYPHAPANWNSVELLSPLAALRTPYASKRIAAGLQPVDLVLLLQSSPLLARATTTQLLALARTARPVTLTRGDDPLVGLEPSILVVLSGAVSVERGGNAPVTADSGDLVGVAETLSGFQFANKTAVVADGTALRFTRADLFDLLADNIDLLQGIFSGLLRARTSAPVGV